MMTTRPHNLGSVATVAGNHPVDTLCRDAPAGPLGVPRSDNAVWLAAERDIFASRPVSERSLSSVPAVAHAFRDGLFLGVPSDADSARIPAAFPTASHDAALRGQVHRRGFGCGDAADALLIEGADGLSLIDNTSQLSVCWEDIVATLHGGGGMVTLVCADGRLVGIVPRQWQNAQALARTIADHTLSEHRVPWPGEPRPASLPGSWTGSPRKPVGRAR